MDPLTAAGIGAGGGGFQFSNKSDPLASLTSAMNSPFSVGGNNSGTIEKILPWALLAIAVIYVIKKV